MLFALCWGFCLLPCWTGHSHHISLPNLPPLSLYLHICFLSASPFVGTARQQYQILTPWLWFCRLVPASWLHISKPGEAHVAMWPVLMVDVLLTCINVNTPSFFPTLAMICSFKTWCRPNPSLLAILLKSLFESEGAGETGERGVWLGGWCIVGSDSQLCGSI